MLRRQVIYFISLVLKLALWTLVLGVGFYVYERGPEDALQDLGWLVGVVMGLEKEGEIRGNRVGREKMRDADRVRTRGGTGRTRNRW